LIAQSKEILELENWNSKIQEMKDIQKEWKNIGFVPRKLDNSLWKEFSEVQKEYFDRLKSGYQRLTSEQEDVLKEKTALLEKIKKQDFTPEVETIKKEYFEQWEIWNDLGSLDPKNEPKMNQSFSNALMQRIKNSGLKKEDLNLVINALQTSLLENDPERLEKELRSVRSLLSNLKSELTQLENNLEFFSNSSSENPLYKSVEKQIQSCQKKIDKAHKEYISLKQIKNAQEKLAREAAEENTADNQESAEGV
jgi:ATP-dependent Lon protease